jgi:hypothetical protein
MIVTQNAMRSNLIQRAIDLGPEPCAEVFLNAADCDAERFGLLLVTGARVSRTRAMLLPD